MAESLALVWDLIARDSASPTFARVGASAEGASLGVGKLLGGLSALAVGGAIAASVDAAAKFQAKMLLIQTQAGATGQEVANMTPKILALAGQVAQAPEALATSLYHVESTGLRGAQALDAVTAAAQGAKVGHADLEETTNALTATIASGMLPATETYSQAMGQLNTIVGSGDMKLKDLNDALGTGLLVQVKQYGVTINDVGAALADFGDNNIRGADAATKVRMAVQAIESPGKGAAAALGRIGLTTKQIADDEKTGGLNKALTDLHDHLVSSGIDSSNWGQLMTDAFTKKAGGGIITLIGTFDRFKQKYEEVSKGADSFGNAWDATTKTASFQFSALKDSVDAFGIKIGTAVLPYVTALAQKINEFLNSQGFQSFLSTTGTLLVDFGHALGTVVNGFMALPGPVKEFAAAIAAVRIAEMVGLFGKLSAGTGGVRTALQGFTADVGATRGVLQSAGVPLAGFAATLQTTAERGVGALRSGLTGLKNSLGGGFGVSLIAAAGFVELLQSSMQHGEDVTKGWTAAIKAGGDAADKARQQMEQTNATLDRANSGVTGFGTKLLGLNTIINSSAGSSKDAQKNYNDWYNSLGLVDQKSQDLQIATAHLNEVLKTHAVDSLAVRDAVNGVRIAQTDQKQAQDLLNNATKTSLQLTQEQASAELALTGSSLAVKQAYDEFTTSLQQYKKDAADPANHSTAQLTTEQDALSQSALGAAQAAGIAGESWAKANGITDTATASQYAQLLSLQKVANAMGKDTPAAITNLIASLGQSVAAGHLTQQQMDAITHAVDGIPNQKGINVTADTSQAEGVINSFLREYQHVQYTGSAIVVNGRVIANAAGNMLSPMPGGTAQVVKPGDLRVIGDNIKSPEAYIPINGSARSLSILGETAARMGLGLHAMAFGGFVSPGGPVGYHFPAQPSGGMLDAAGRTAGQFGQTFQASMVAASAGGAARWAPLVDQVLAMLGISRSAEAGVLSLINSESGGNPNAINLWDSNAKAGHPSAGLTQTIPSTFARWRSPNLPNNILDPAASIYAGVNYALHNYGLGMLMGGGNHGAGGKYIGYKDGTNYVPSNQFAMLHRGEAVVPADKNQGAPYRDSGRTAPLIHIENAYDTTDLELRVRQAMFADSSYGGVF